MQAFFLEEPFYLIPTVLLLQLILVSGWLRTRWTQARRIALGGFILFSSLIVLQAVITTDRERIHELCHKLAHIVERGDAPALAEYLAEDLTVVRRRGEPWDRDAFIERVRKTLQVYRVEDSRLHQVQINTQGNRATVELRATCRIVAPTERYPSLFSRWELDFVRTQEQWKLQSVRRGTLEPVGVDLLDELL